MLVPISSERAPVTVRCNEKHRGRKKFVWVNNTRIDLILNNCSQVVGDFRNQKVIIRNRRPKTHDAIDAIEKMLRVVIRTRSASCFFLLAAHPHEEKEAAEDQERCHRGNP